ncbi:tetratricopeptide repeat protein [Blautia stercoris]
MKLTEVKILDKKEYRARLDEINSLVEKQDYREALNVVETIEWRRVRSARTLCMVSEIYEVNKRYDDSLRLLLLAYQRAPSGKLILYRLVELSVKMTDYESAVKYYNQFMKLSPNDNNRYILKYKIYKGRKNPIEDQIKILEKYKASEYTERWAYELARLYARAGMYDKCIAECDEMVLWFSDGKYVKKALELKMKYTELTDAEKEKYKELYGEPKAVRIARTAASVSAATQAAAKMLNQTAQTMAKPEDAVNSVKAEAFQLPKPEPVKKAESETESEAKAEAKPELAEQPKVMEMPEFIKTPEVKPDFEPLPEIQMPEEIKKEIEEELEKKKAVEAKLQEETAKIAEEEPVKEFDLEAALGVAAAEMAQAEKTEAVENEAEAKAEMEVPEGATIQLPLEEIKAARQNAVETDATVDLSNVVEEAMAEAVVTAEEETAEKVVEAETEASEEKVAEAETEEPQEEKAPESVETEESQEEQEPESAETEQEPVEVEEARESEPAQWVLEEPVESEEENAESEAVQEIEAVTEVEPESVEPESEKVLRHHLTDEEHRRLFTYFAPIPGMKEQVKEALDIAQKSACEKTSKAGNMIVTGRSGSGKTRFSESLIKALCKERQMEGAKVAYLTAEVLNKKDPAFIVDKLSGGFLAIGRASAMTAQTVENLSKAMEFKTNRLTVILEDSKAGIYTLKQDYPEFMEKFDSRIVIPVFTNDELVSFAKTYAKEKGYKVDDIAVLAVYSLIGDNQYEDDPVCVGQVREMMDSAIAKASRLGRRPGKKVAKRHLDVTGRIMLYEKDFNL